MKLGLCLVPVPTITEVPGTAHKRDTRAVLVEVGWEDRTEAGAENALAAAGSRGPGGTERLERSPPRPVPTLPADASAGSTSVTKPRVAGGPPGAADAQEAGPGAASNAGAMWNVGHG